MQIPCYDNNIINHLRAGGTIFLEIYLDNAATTRPKASMAMRKHLESLWYNPSAAYGQAEAVFKEIKQVRQQLCSAVRMDGTCLFTSGGTEANNLALTALSRRGAHIVVSAIEHPSVYETCRQLEQTGVRVDYVKPRGLIIHPEDVAALVTEETALVSVMNVNNETGALNDVTAIGRAVKAKNPAAFFHSDGVQALLKTNIDLSGGFVDVYTVSAHKIHAFKGTGALLLRKGVSIRPMLYGGGQELSLRAGTENTLGIAAFGEALDAGTSELSASIDKMRQLRDAFVAGIAVIDGAVAHVPERFAPHIVSVSVEGVRGEVLARAMGEKGVMIGTGAACSRGKVSRVLLECGVARAMAEGTVRISFCADNTLDEVAVCLDIL
jgi:cysteine desulfurase